MNQKRFVPEFIISSGKSYSNDPAYWGAVRELLTGANKQFGARAVNVLDKLSHYWLKTNKSKYLSEMEEIAGKSKEAGVFFLNLSYEWGCSVGIMDNGRNGVKMFRFFDWGLDGLGKSLCYIRRETPIGSYISLTWPMFVGEITVVAPNRFTIAMNRAPLNKNSLIEDFLPQSTSRFLYWTKFLKSKKLPPTHLLRLTAETARTAREAIEILMCIPICRPAIFCIAGLSLEDSGIIERTETEAVFRAGQTVATNHWTEREWGIDVSEDENSRMRFRAMEAINGGQNIEDCCIPPILSQSTQYAAEIDLTEPEMTVIAFEGGKAVTYPTKIRLKNF